MGWPVALAAGIGATSSLLSGVLSNWGKSDDNFGKMKDLQLAFAQNALRWRVEDAKRAGIHPLAALGANVHSFAPQYIGGRQKTDYGVGAAGQDIARAVRQIKTAEEKKLEDFAMKLAELKVGEQELRNEGMKQDLLERRLNNQNEISIPSKKGNYLKGLGIIGQGIKEYDLPEDKLYQVQPVPKSWSMGTQAGAAPMGQYKHDRFGILSYWPGQEAMDFISESVPAAFKWWKDLAKYKWVISKGLQNPGTKEHKFYLKEKRKLEKNTMRSVYWNGWNWQFEGYGHKKNVERR